MNKLLTPLVHILFFLFFCGSIFGQNSMLRFSFFPDVLLMQPQRANFTEPKIGLIYYPENKHLKVDIGNSIDLISAEIEKTRWEFAAGIDFFAYAWSKNISGNRLQISAVDGFFGGHVTAVKEHKTSIFGFRFRFIHNSSHLVDGNWDYNNKVWRDNREPIPFTRDFGEFMMSYSTRYNFFSVRFYSSASYATLVRPKNLERSGFNAGIEINSPEIFGSVNDDVMNLFAAYHVALQARPNLVPSHNLMLGIKLGKWNGKGVDFYCSYFVGNTPFNEFFEERIKRIGIGFFVEFI